MFIFDIYHIEKGELWGGLHSTRNTQKTAHDTQNMCVIHLWLHFYMLAFRMKCVPCSVFMKRVDTVGYKGNVYNGNSSHRYIFHSLKLVIAIGIFRANFGHFQNSMKSWLWAVKVKSNQKRGRAPETARFDLKRLHPKFHTIRKAAQKVPEGGPIAITRWKSVQSFAIAQSTCSYVFSWRFMFISMHTKTERKKNPASKIYIICAYLLVSIARIFL